MEELDLYSCRICLGKNNLSSIYEEDHGTKISDKVMYCASVQISKLDMLPSLICKKCKSYAHISYLFKTVCEGTNAKLQKIIYNMNDSQNFAYKELNNKSINIVDQAPCTEIGDVTPIKESNVKPTTVLTEIVAIENISYYDDIEESFNNFIHEVEIEDTNIVKCDESIIPLSKEYVQIYETVDNNKEENETKAQSPIGRHIAMKKAGQHPRKLSQINAEKDVNFNKDSDISYEEDDISDEALSDIKMSEDTIKTNKKRKSGRVIRMKKFREYISKKTVAKKNADKKRLKIEIENNKYDLNGNSYTCNVCNKTFSFRSHLIRHLNMHTGIKQFKCKYCNKQFINKYNLSVHLKRHVGDFTLKCNICLKGFSSPSILKRHMPSHTGELSFQCKFCKKQFSQSGSLKLHEYMHVHNPSYSCHICYKEFSYTNSLAAHLRTHTGIKAHKCTICSRAFTRNSSLQRHMACHKYICKICDIDFNTNITYSEHLKIHKYNCSHCNLQFETNILLLTHVNNKHNELICEQCGEKFITKIMLIKHLQKHLNSEI